MRATAARGTLARAADAAAFRDGALGVIDADDLSAARDDEGPKSMRGTTGKRRCT